MPRLKVKVWSVADIETTYVVDVDDETAEEILGNNESFLDADVDGRVEEISREYEVLGNNEENTVTHVEVLDDRQETHRRTRSSTR